MLYSTRKAARRHAPPRPPSGTAVSIAIDGIRLDGDLLIPRGAPGLVVFAHCSGRHSPRNRRLAEEVQRAGVGTFLLDLLTAEEERIDALTTTLRFDIPLLATRLGTVTDIVMQRPETRQLRVGYLGAGTGAAAALIAAAQRPHLVAAVVSRGGHPELAGPFLSRVRAPTLLVVGEADEHALEPNRRALHSLAGPKRLEVVTGATHLFEEPGALDEVARLAREWFARHLGTSAGWQPSPGDAW